MISWDELLKLDLGHPQKSFPRTRSSESTYTAHKKTLSDLGVTPEQHIESTVLKGREYDLSANAFPYDVAPDITHLLFWMTPDAEKLSMESVKQITAAKYQVEPECVVVFENPPGLKSIQGITHYQVFIRA